MHIGVDVGVVLGFYIIFMTFSFTFTFTSCMYVHCVYIQYMYTYSVYDVFVKSPHTFFVFYDITDQTGKHPRGAGEKKKKPLCVSLRLL